MGSFIAVGNALLTIRDRHLYREKFKTFEDYCKEKWAVGKSYANYLIRGSQVAVNLSTLVEHCPLVKSSRSMKDGCAPWPALSPPSNARCGRKL